MTGLQAICILLIRLWAAGVIISYLLGYAYWFMSALTGNDQEGLSDLLINAAIWISGALAGWCLAPPLSRLVVPRAASDNLQITMGAEDFVAVGSFLIGGVFLVRTAPDLLAVLVNILGSFATRETDAPPPDIHYQSRQLISAVVTVAVALFLTFKPRDIAKMFVWLRRAGLAKLDEAD